MEVLRVSTKSNPNAVAGALAGVIREKGTAELQTIGAGALNQAVKAIAIARGFLAPSGMDLICRPAFAGHHRGWSGAHRDPADGRTEVITSSR